MVKLVSDKAPASAWLGLQPPANRDLAREQLKLAADMGAKAKALGEDADHDSLTKDIAGIRKMTAARSST